MIKNYILIALRKLSRERAYVLINILSLALGIASFLILALYLRSELTYDQHNVNYRHIYRLITHFKNQGSEGDNFALSQMGIGPLLLKDYPQLGKLVRFNSAGMQVTSYQDKKKIWDHIYLADPEVFEVFTHKIIYGDPKTAFSDKYSIAISETMSKFYFGNENPIGKKLSAANSYAVTLVFADLPANSHFKYDALLPFNLLEVYNPNMVKNYANTLWGVGIYTYFMPSPGFKVAEFDGLAKSFVERYMAEQGKKFKTEFRPTLQSLADLHFGEKLGGDQPTGNIFYVYGFAAVAIFILLVACVNYMNLATARATKRAKEVGMRKVLGASKGQLVAQFLGESATFTAIALVAGLIMVEMALALTPLGSLMGNEQLLEARKDPTVLLGVLGLGVLVALISGLYPAFYLSAISPLAALTQVKRSWKTGFSMRQVLVFLQLAISVGVIACTWLMMDQIRYIHDTPLGFDKENRMIVTLRGYDVVKNIKTIKSELRRQPGVLNVMSIAMVPGVGHAVNLIPIENNAGVIEPTSVDRIVIGMTFVEDLKVKLLEGRSFSEDIATDAREAVMVNESLVKKMGWENPLGKRVQAGMNVARVIGVVQDFHYASLHNPVGPLMINPLPEQYGNVPDLQKSLLSASIIVNLSGEAIGATMKRVEKVLATFDPNFYFEPAFLEDRLNELYKSETNLMKLTGVFAAICILIAVMGLFGLAAFTTEQRTKEIGIRKVLGSSDSQIVALLSLHLLPLVIAAAIPASILSYYAINKWLEKFAYHTDISLMSFVLATLLVTVVALGTVIVQSTRTAQSNPVDALRYE